MKIIQESAVQEKWSAKIRCCKPVCYGLSKVEGCFSILEITHEDIKSHCDSDGDWNFTVTCSVCGLTQYPKWQIGEGPLEFIMKRDRKR